jgi:signal peptidase I
VCPFGSLYAKLAEKRDSFVALRILAVMANLILPGLGLSILGRLHWALVTQACLLLTVAILCWSRLVFSPTALTVSLIIIGLVYLISSGLCFYVSHSNQRKSWCHSLLFIGLSVGLLALGFGYKPQLLGVHVYFIPSPSMVPTLEPGQFILIDTWAYDDALPSIGDVVVFRHQESAQWLVKRISRWPDGEIQHNDQWYMLGDNKNQSRDSRYFGGITTDQIVGQVKLILAGIDKDNHLIIHSIGATVN